ncbi:MAG: CYTH domain-containing protein [Candidatus Paceibacterota bacterium]
METELEAQFIDIDQDKVRSKLRDIGATLVHEERMTRAKIYEHPTKKETDWFRVRDEGDKITLSYKKLVDRSLHGTKEISLTVPSFDKACAILEVAHLKFMTYQEKKRESWKYNDVEIEIDTWPWIPTFIEIESLDAEKVKQTARELGFKWEDALFGSVENIYQIHYDVTEREVDTWPEILFSEVPDWLEKKRRK